MTKPPRAQRTGTREGIALYYRRPIGRQAGSGMNRALGRTIRAPARALVLCVALTGLALTCPAAAETAEFGLPRDVPEPVTAGRVAAVIDGDTLILENGTHVRLTGIQAPKLPLGRPGFRAWPLGEAAKRALEALAGGKAVGLSYDGRRIDRWRRLLAHVEADGVWLQGEMLRRGLARVYTFPDNVARAADLYAAERAARAAGRGIWALRAYRIRTAEDAADAIGTFQLVEGTPLDVATVRGRTYLNYGRDWRTDFTASVSARAAGRFRAAGIDLKSLAGRRLRVRGWLTRQNGAMIRLTHPEQIEILTGR